MLHCYVWPLRATDVCQEKWQLHYELWLSMMTEPAANRMKLAVHLGTYCQIGYDGIHFNVDRDNGLEVIDSAGQAQLQPSAGDSLWQQWLSHKQGGCIPMQARHASAAHLHAVGALDGVDQVVQDVKDTADIVADDGQHIEGTICHVLVNSCKTVDCEGHSHKAKEVHETLHKTDHCCRSVAGDHSRCESQRWHLQHVDITLGKTSDTADLHNR